MIIYNTNTEYSNVSRYQLLRVITSDNTRYLETFNQRSIKESKEDIYHMVTASEENRLDIISNKYYNTPVYWWALAIANDMIDPYIVEIGSMIRIPPISSLFNYDNKILAR